MDYAVTEPIREFARRRKLSPTTVYGWAHDGLIETFLLGARRHVVISSYERLVQRLVTEQQGQTKLVSPNPRAPKLHTEMAAPPSQHRSAAPRRDKRRTRKAPR